MNRLEISEDADSDVIEIWNYLNDYNSKSADTIVDEITGTYETLAQFPRMGRSRDDLKAGERSFSVRGYVIFYHLILGGIRIDRVVHGARDLSTLFSAES